MIATYSIDPRQGIKNFRPRVNQCLLGLKKMTNSQFRRLAIGITILFLLVYPLHYLSQHPLDSMIEFKYVDPFGDETRQYTSINKGDNYSLVLFPLNLEFNEEDVRVAFNISEEDAVVQYPNVTLPIVPVEKLHEPTTYHKIQVFNSMSDSENCEDFKRETGLSISDNTIVRQDFEFMLQRLDYQLKNEEAMSKLASFFQDRLDYYLKWKVYHFHFYQFAGTSVYLKNHGVHLMVSRVIHSLKGRKGDPQISLLYAQVYDTNWQELTNVELILPVRDIHGDKVLQKLTFPRFLLTPFYHNAEFTKQRWYGPEDARMLLSINEDGDEEPVIIYNAYHRKIHNQTEVSTNDKVITLNFDFYRSMFITWPFRYQLGKLNTDGFEYSAFDNVTYNKALELKIEGQPRKQVEKNWTPFFDPKLRNPNDKFIHMVYQWDGLQILKCDLETLASEDGGLTKYSSCRFEFNEQPTDIQDAFGPIRGGTELIPMDGLDKERQVWIGFLRTHINKCGCGKAMYRPNFVVLEKQSNQFKVTHLSSYLSLNIPVPGWKDPDVQCSSKDPSALIPNGISNWETRDGQDVLTMTLSVADEKNVLINIHDLRNTVTDLISGSFDWFSTSYKLRQMKCVVEYSSNFCNAYGQEQYNLGLTDSLFGKFS
ncbi:Beta-mannosyltransferase 6 [Candida viswanathii]|uniref:Beta-mannosyltransferase 6 n=1 Tax=Candida viswanathii TaxID=5486 RepID=A0A367YHD7_9ASCO|nr:Beta-mannosyltransferase 6 [Candida viswanathii]